MTAKHLHIISLDVPFPADYGGVIDIFYKIKWLSEAGIKIHLHCFSNGRPPRDELDEYCEEVFYYKRKNFLQALPLTRPYMIGSRSSSTLVQNLKKDNYPILLEGVQCAAILLDKELPGRSVFLRLHNVEFLYYLKLAEHESNWFKRLYYNNEARLLKKTEATLSRRIPIIALSKTDMGVYKKFFGASNIVFIPAFTPWNEISIEEGSGKYCLYHGNLAINENEKAVEWLLTNVFAGSAFPLIVAGKHPSEKMQQMVTEYANCSLVENPTDTDLQLLIKQAHVNVLPSFNVTGVKLKLLNALFNGRFCVVNRAGIKGTELEGQLGEVETPAEFIAAIKAYFSKDFTREDIETRKNMLAGYFDNKNNAAQLINRMNLD